MGGAITGLSIVIKLTTTNKKWIAKMRYQIIARRMSPPDSRHYQHIVAVQWRANGQVGQSTRQDMVTALEIGHTAYVQGSASQSEVGVKEDNGVKYLRSYANDYWDDNLLSLPTF